MHPVFPSFIVRKVPSRIFFTTSHFITTLALIGFGIFVQHIYLTSTPIEESPLDETFSNPSITNSTHEILENDSETNLPNNYPNFVQYFGWVPLVAIIVTFVMRSGGILPILRVLQNELYPTEIRSQGSGITDSSVAVLASLTILAYPHVKKIIGIQGVFFFFASISMLCTIWGFIKIPDTRGKSLVKVEEMFEMKKMSAVSAAIIFNGTKENKSTV